MTMLRLGTVAAVAHPFNCCLSASFVFCSNFFFSTERIKRKVLQSVKIAHCTSFGRLFFFDCCVQTSLDYTVIATEDEAADTEPGCCRRVMAEMCQLKWLVLVVSCVLNLGMTYTMDFPGSLGCGSSYSIEAHFHAEGKHYTQSMNQALYSAYSWPNTVLAVVGGILIDRYVGLRRSLLLFSALVFAGAFIFGFGVRMANYPLMVLGRVVYGLGGESLSVAQSTFLSRWFSKDSGMSFAFGITISFARVGSSFNFLVSPVIATHSGIFAAISIGTVLCFISLLAGVVLYGLDARAVRLGLIEPDAVEASQGVASGADSEDADDVLPVVTMKLSDAFRLSTSFWYLCGICLFSYNAVSPFVGIAKNFFQVKYGYDGLKASQFLSSYQITSAVASPLVGFVVDKMGRNTYILIAVSAAFALIHVLFIATAIPAVGLLMATGVFFSFLAAALWPAVPLVVPSQAVGLSFGIMTSLQNIGLALFPMLVGAILDAQPQDTAGSDGTVLPTLEGFQQALLLFLACALLSAGFSAALLIRDLHHGCVLTLSAAERLENPIVPVFHDEDEDDEEVPEQRQSLLDHPQDEEEA
eukprot:gene8633-6064_t